MGRPRKSSVPGSTEPAGARTSVLLQWASETGAHGMAVPVELERLGWHRLAEHPLFRGTWLMESVETGALSEGPGEASLQLAAKPASE